MSSDTESAIFPLTLSFKRDPYHITFDTVDQFVAWRNKESGFWQQYSGQGDQIGQINNQLLTTLRSQDTANLEQFRSRLNGFIDSYLPSESPFGRMVSRINEADPNIARTALAIFLSPQTTLNWNNNPAVLQALVIASSYRALGDPLGSRQQIEEAFVEVQDLRDAAVNAKERFDNLFREADEEWKQKIEGFVTATALAAPRQYWSERAKKHEGLADEARHRWTRWTAGTVIVFGLLGFIMFTPIGEAVLEAIDSRLGVQPTSSNAGEALALLTGFLKRTVVFGSLLGIAVWWLRQLLRELRSHEHLGEDAAERVTMIETYAALRGSGEDFGDLTPILSAFIEQLQPGLSLMKPEALSCLLKSC